MVYCSSVSVSLGLCNTSKKESHLCYKVLITVRFCGLFIFLKPIFLYSCRSVRLELRIEFHETSNKIRKLSSCSPV